MEAVALAITTRVIRERYPEAVVTPLRKFKFQGTNFAGRVRVTGYGFRPIVYAVRTAGPKVSLWEVA